MSMNTANPPETYAKMVSKNSRKRIYHNVFPPAPCSVATDSTLVSGASIISTRSNASDHVSSKKRTKYEGKNRQMDLLIERTRLKDTSSLTHGPIPRKAVLGATFAKSKKPASLFQGYHQRTKHVGSDFTLIPHQGRGTTEYMVRHCSGLETNEIGDIPNNVLRKLNNGMTREDLGAIPLSTPMPDWLLTVLSNPPDRTEHIPSKASSISVVPSQPRLPQTPRKDDEESVFAFAPPSLSPPPPKLASLVTSTPQFTHASLPTLTSARPHSKCSQLSTLTTCSIPIIIPNRLLVSPSSSPFPVSPQAALLTSFPANIDQTQPAYLEPSQSSEYLPPSLPYRCPRIVDTVNDPSDPDPVGRIWRQERDIAQKERTVLQSRVCKLSSLQTFKRDPMIMAQTETLPDCFIDAGPDKGIEQLWVPSFPDAKTPSHRLTDPGRSQLRRRDFLGSTNPIITPQVLAAEAASVNKGLPGVYRHPTTASKVKFWIPDIHSSPFSAARSFITVSPAQDAECLSQNIDTTTTPSHQQSSVYDFIGKVTEYPVKAGPELSGGPQEDNLQAPEDEKCETDKNGYDSGIPASWETGPEEYSPDSAEYYDTMSIDLNHRDEWVFDCLVEGAHGRDVASPPGLIEFDPPHGDWEKSHTNRRDYTTPVSRKYSRALNSTKASESKSGSEFNHAFVDAIATMQKSRTKSHPRNPDKPYPSTPDLARAKPPRTKDKDKNVIIQTPKHNNSFESIESWGANY